MIFFFDLYVCYYPVEIFPVLEYIFFFSNGFLILSNLFSSNVLRISSFDYSLYPFSTESSTIFSSVLKDFSRRFYLRLPSSAILRALSLCWQINIMSDLFIRVHVFYYMSFLSTHNLRIGPGSFYCRKD